MAKKTNTGVDGEYVEIKFTVFPHSTTPEVWQLAADYAESSNAGKIQKALEVGANVLSRLQSSQDVEFVKNAISLMLVDFDSRAAKIVDAVEKRFEEFAFEALEPGHPKSYGSRIASAIAGSVLNAKESVAKDLALVSHEVEKLQRNTDESEASFIGRTRKIVDQVEKMVVRHFDNTDTTGMAYRFEKMLESVTSQMDATVRAGIQSAVRMEVGAQLTPLTADLSEIKGLLMKAEGKAEVADLISGKGFTFEDELFKVLQQIAAPLSETVVEAGLVTEVTGSKKGDFIYTLAAGTRIVIEAKDKEVKLAASLTYMKQALLDRGLAYGILIGKHTSDMQEQIGAFNIYDNIIICSAEMTYIALRYMRGMVQSQTTASDDINVGNIKTKLAAMLQVIKRIVELKKQLSNMNKAVDDVSAKMVTGLDALYDELVAIEEDIQVELD